MRIDIKTRVTGRAVNVRGDLPGVTVVLYEVPGDWSVGLTLEPLEARDLAANLLRAADHCDQDRQRVEAEGRFK